MGLIDELERLDQRLLGAYEAPAELDTAFWRLVQRRPEASFAVAATMGAVLLWALVTVTERGVGLSAALAAIVAVWIVAAMCAVPRTLGRPVAFGVVQGTTVTLVVLAFSLGEWPGTSAVTLPLLAGVVVGTLLGLGQRPR